MNNKERLYFQSQEDQDKEFLQKVQKCKVFLFDVIFKQKNIFISSDNLNNTQILNLIQTFNPPPFAQFSNNGKQFHIFTHQETLNFDQSFSPYQGIYLVNDEDYISYIGIRFWKNNIFMYMSDNFDTIFSNKSHKIYIHKP